MDRWNELIQQSDADIRAGQLGRVARRLSKLNPSRVPRAWRSPLAKICRRAGFYTLGLSMLERLVHPGRMESGHDATPAELAEYAALLLRTGSVFEARGCLDRVDAEKAPDALLYRAFAHFVRWEFEEAIPHLEAYLRAPINEYSTLVGRTNLGYALVETKRHADAHEILENVIQIAERGGSQHLSRTCRSFRAQAFFQQGDLVAARKEIESARAPFSTAITNDHFLAEKWMLILDGVEHGREESWKRLRELSRKNRDWASLREADFYSLKINFEKERFLHLLFGSPFPAFQERIRSEIRPTDQSTYVLGPKSAPCLDLRTGEIDGSPSLKPGRMSHRLIEILLRDFYQPWQIVALFSELFPGEHFFVSSSPDRIHQIIRRTRQWLKSESVPVGIREDNGFYSLELGSGFSFLVPLERRQIEPVSLHFDSLIIKFDNKVAFSAKQARERLGLSKTTINRLLNWGIDAGKIERLWHTNRAAEYRVIGLKIAA